MNSLHDSISGWLGIALERHVVKRSLMVSLIVGSVLAGINHGDVLLNSEAGRELLWKIPLSYCVPYAVSTFASVDALRQNKETSIRRREQVR